MRHHAPSKLTARQATGSSFQLHCQSPFCQTVRAVHSLLIHGHEPAHHACRPLTPRRALTCLIKPHRPVDCSTGAELKYNPGYVSRTVYRDGPQPGWGIFPYQAQSSQLLAKGRCIFTSSNRTGKQRLWRCVMTQVLHRAAELMLISISSALPLTQQRCRETGADL